MWFVIVLFPPGPDKVSIQRLEYAIPHKMLICRLANLIFQPQDQILDKNLYYDW